MRNKLYLECTSGISGDMTVAALLDLGADQKKLVRILKSLPVKGFDIKVSRVMKSGGEATPLSESKHSQQPAADEPSSASQAQAAELLSEGKKTIDKMWKESGIDTIRSVEKKSEAFYQFVDKSNEFITTTYPQTFSRDIAGKADIIYELSSYNAERYIRPTLSGFQSSR